MVPTILIMDEINEGNRLFPEKKFQDAIKKYNIVLDKEPDNLIALNNKGYSLSKLKKYSDAESEFKKALEVRKTTKGLEKLEYLDAEAYSGLGWAKYNQKNYPEAKKYSGNIIYVDNRPSITRSVNQKEDIKVILQF